MKFLWQSKIRGPHVGDREAWAGRGELNWPVGVASGMVYASTECDNHIHLRGSLCDVL